MSKVDDKKKFDPSLFQGLGSNPAGTVTEGYNNNQNTQQAQDQMNNALQVENQAAKEMLQTGAAELTKEANRGNHRAQQSAAATTAEEDAAERM